MIESIFYRTQRKRTNKLNSNFEGMLGERDMTIARLYNNIENSLILILCKPRTLNSVMRSTRREWDIPKDSSILVQR